MSNQLDNKLNQLSPKNLNLYKLRHTAEHVLHQAVKELFPQIHLAMGPATDDGFYFDFDPNPEDKEAVKISELDFKTIEKRMRQIINKNLPLIQQKISIDDAKKLFSDNPYKLEWIDLIKKRGEKVSIYWTGKPNQPGSMVDLCSGPHATSTGAVKAFKLLSVAGAYWHGDEKNKMLTRIYGTAFASQKELDRYLTLLEEAKKRDHRKLGIMLDLYVINDDIGKGLPLLTPKGTVIRNQILSYEKQLELTADFQEVWTPHIAKNNLYKRTGHWDHYQDVMYAPFGIDDETYVLKPMNCPHHYMIYQSRPRSYRELPIRYTEPGTCYRYEKSGELGGLTRVRALTIDDSHIIMTEDQIDQEFSTCIDMVKHMFQAFGLSDYYVRLSLNDPDDNVKYIADSATWKKAGKKLEQIIKANNLRYHKGAGEASFYGPKIDFMVQDAIGREWQMSTLQLDLFMAKRLELTYIDHHGESQHPVILHRGLTGSIERTIGLLIEHFAGAFPIWLAPVQAIIIPISADQQNYARKIEHSLKQSNIRVETWTEASMQKRIRNAEKIKVPYMLIVGDREVADQTLSVRSRGEHDLGNFKPKEFIQKISKLISSKSLSLNLD